MKTQNTGKNTRDSGHASRREAPQPASLERFPLPYRLFFAIFLPVAGMAFSMLTLLLDEGGARSAETRLLFAAGVLFTAISLALAVLVATNLLRTLRRLTEKLAGAGDEVGIHSENLSTAGYKLSSGATEAASSLEETASSIEELSSMVKLTAESAREASELSQSSRSSAEEGEKRIHGLITSMQTMAQQSKRIEDIITLIDDVAFQTNLLALNAAVEAARAGEQGKGFAVVAEAVRSLASRSAEASKDIGRLVRETVGSIEAGSTLAADSENALREIVENVRKVADLNNRIASANQEQANGIEQITQAVNQLDAATQVNAASAEQAAASAADLAHQADALEDLVARLSFLAGRSTDTRPAAKRPAQKVSGTALPLQAEAREARKQEAGARTIPLPGDAAARPTPRREPAKAAPMPLEKNAPVQPKKAVARERAGQASKPLPAAAARPAAARPATSPVLALSTARKAKPAGSAAVTAESLLPLPGDPSPGSRASAGSVESRETRDDKVIPLGPARGSAKAKDEGAADPDELVSPLGARKVQRDPRQKRFSNLSGF